MFIRYNDSWAEEDEDEENVAAAGPGAAAADATANDLRIRMQEYLITWYHQNL